MFRAETHDTTADRLESSAAVGFLHPSESIVLPVLEVDPVLRPTSLIRLLRHEALKTHLAGRAGEITADLAARSNGLTKTPSGRRDPAHALPLTLY